MHQIVANYFTNLVNQPVFKALWRTLKADPHHESRLNQPPAMSRGVKLRSSTFHSRYFSAGRKPKGRPSFRALLAACSTAGPSREALASIRIGSFASVPFGRRLTRSTTRVAGARPSGAFQHLRRCVLKAARSSSERLAFTVA